MPSTKTKVLKAHIKTQDSNSLPTTLKPLAFSCPPPSPPLTESSSHPDMTPKSSVQTQPNIPITASPQLGGPVVPMTNPESHLYHPYLYPVMGYPHYRNNMYFPLQNAMSYGGGPQFYGDKTLPMKKPRNEGRTFYGDDGMAGPSRKATNDTEGTDYDPLDSEIDWPTLERSNKMFNAASRAQASRKAKTKEKELPTRSGRLDKADSNLRADQRLRARMSLQSKIDGLNDGDGSEDLLSRISSAIPDLHLLLSRYKETNGELGLQDELRRTAEAQQAEMIKSKEETIQGLMLQLEEEAKSHAGELNKLRSRVISLEEKQKDLEEQCSELERRAKSAEEAKKRLVKHNDRLLIDNSEIVRRISEDRQKALAKHERELKIEFMRDRETQKARSEGEKGAIKSKFESDIDSLKAKFEEEKKELESKLSKEKDEIQEKLSELESKLSKLGETESEIRQNLEKEFEEKREALQNEHHEEILQLATKHQDIVNDQTRGFLTLQEALNKQMTADNTALREEIEQLKQKIPGD